jgi:hemophore-related protein
MLTARATRRLVVPALAGAATCAALLGVSPIALADNVGQNPPGCTAADMEGVRAGVDASTSAYLFTHPDLNGFMNSLQHLSRAQVAEHVTGYMETHPQENAEMIGIRQPLTDIKNHCGSLVNP